jgi:putative membrane protein
MTIRSLARCAALLAAISAPLAAADPPRTSPTTSPSTSGKLDPDELQLLAHYHGVNQTEIMLGKLAQQKATRTAVKNYGAMLVRDHTANDRKLMALAKAHNATLPAETLSAADRDAMQQMQDDIARIKTASGADFERQFLAFSVSGHEQELSRIDASITQTTAPDLKTFLEDTKPVLQRHADDARELAKSATQASK